MNHSKLEALDRTTFGACLFEQQIDLAIDLVELDEQIVLDETGCVVSPRRRVEDRHRVDC